MKRCMLTLIIMSLLTSIGSADETLWQDFTKLIVGDWTGHGTILAEGDGGPLKRGDEFTLRGSYRKVANGKAILGSQVLTVDGSPARSFDCTVTFGWEPVDKTITIDAYWSEGAVERITLGAQKDDSFVGTYTIHLPTGKKDSADVIVKTTGNDRFAWTFTSGLNAGKTLSTWHRIDSSSEEDKYVTFWSEYFQGEWSTTVVKGDGSLQELGDLLVGRWVGDVTLVADWPGIGKKGDKVIGYETIRWILDGHALESEMRIGNGGGKSLIVWDAAAKTIRGTGTSAGTGTWSNIFRKDGDHWSVKGVGCLNDGTKTRGTHKIIMSEGGTVRTNTGGGGYVGDEKQLPLHDVWTKIENGASTVPPLKEFGDLLVGRWQGDVKWVADWPGASKKGDKVTAYMDVEWMLDGQALRTVWKAGAMQGEGIMFWDGKNKKIRQLFAWTNGIMRREEMVKDGDKWLLRILGAFPDGKLMEADSYIEFADEGKTLVNTGKVTIDGEEQDPLRDVYRKLSK